MEEGYNNIVTVTKLNRAPIEEIDDMKTGLEGFLNSLEDVFGKTGGSSRARFLKKIRKIRFGPRCNMLNHYLEYLARLYNLAELEVGNNVVSGVRKGGVFKKYETVFVWVYKYKLKEAATSTRLPIL